MNNRQLNLKGVPFPGPLFFIPLLNISYLLINAMHIDYKRLVKFK
jgi:hypothetical protein